MATTSDLVALFTSVTACARCAAPAVLRDTDSNIPQPGWVGRRYAGLMFIGQNPGARRVGAAQLAADIPYINALRTVDDAATLDRMHDVLKVSAEAFVYYRSFGFDVDMERVAYINAVRCRTSENAAPGKAVVQACRTHLARWLDVLAPRGVVYLGTFAEAHTSDLLLQRRIRYVSISRQRSLSAERRQAQMAAATAFIAEVLDR